MVQEQILWVAALSVALVGCLGGIVAGVGGIDLYDKSKVCRDDGDTDLQHGRAAAIAGVIMGGAGILAVAVVTYCVIARWPEAMVRRDALRIRDPAL